jgi:hypothetical protein
MRILRSSSRMRRGTGLFKILESNCYAAIGVLAGLQMSAGKASQRLGIVWIDAHGDRNTPETTLSGMLSGMPVAIATGLCLDRFRKQSGLDAPIDQRDTVMVCVRVNDPLEEELIDQLGIEMVPVLDVKGDCRKLRAAMERLSRSVDAIYVHFDVDALDEAEVASMWLTAPDGPTARELAAAIEIVMAYPKITAFGIADINPERDVDGQMVQATLAVVKAVLPVLPADFVFCSLKSRCWRSRINRTKMFYMKTFRSFEFFYTAAHAEHLLTCRYLPIDLLCARLGELCKQLDMVRQSATQHLDLLEGANLVSTV